jgi:tetratricopeptide (TPR) repeat protein
LRQLDEYEEALRWFEYGCGFPSETTFLAPSHYYRGEIYEELGDIEQAIWHYEAFAELWKDADPELQVKRREVLAHISELRGEPLETQAAET